MKLGTVISHNGLHDKPLYMMKETLFNFQGYLFYSNETSDVV